MSLFKNIGIFALSLSLVGCFTPLYGEHGVMGKNGEMVKVKTAEQLKSVEIAAIVGRHGVVMRNDLIFSFSGSGDQPEKPVYRLFVTQGYTASLLVVDTAATRPQSESYTLNADYRLVEIATQKEVFKGSAFSTASIDVGQQRFARDRARLDAYDRTSRVVADQITTHVASFFAGKTK
jgi:LPS-assembly lipoprotein